MTLEEFTNNIVINRNEGGSFSAVLQLPPDLSAFQGHFPGNPVLPGVAYIYIAEKLASTFTGLPLVLKQLKKTKFFAPSFPLDQLEISGTVSCDPADETNVNVQVSFTGEQQKRVCLVKMSMEK